MDYKNNFIGVQNYEIKPIFQNNNRYSVKEPEVIDNRIYEEVIPEIKYIDIEKFSEEELFEYCNFSMSKYDLMEKIEKNIFNLCIYVDINENM